MDYKKWEEIRKGTEDYISQLKTSMNYVDGEEKDIAHYVLTGSTNNEGHVILNAGNLAKKPEEERYERLGDYVTMQILTDPKYESVAYAIKADYMTYDDVKNNVINGLKNHNIITNGNYNNEAELRNMITSGKIKNMVTDSIIRQTKAKARDHSRMQAANPQAPNHQPANPGQQGPGIHH